jgi:hypothetical protein
MKNAMQRIHDLLTMVQDICFENNIQFAALVEEQDGDTTDGYACILKEDRSHQMAIFQESIKDDEFCCELENMFEYDDDDAGI